MSMTVGNLDRVNPVIIDTITASDVREFAKAYLAGNRGNHRAGGPTEADDKAAERFASRYTSQNVRHGFAGSGEVEYRDNLTGRSYRVIRSANGRGFYGTSHHVVAA